MKFLSKSKVDIGAKSREKGSCNIVEKYEVSEDGSLKNVSSPDQSTVNSQKEQTKKVTGNRKSR